MVPIPSTWPDTMWPPKRPSAGMARSRLTREPGARADREVLRRVSCMTSAVKAPLSMPVTVRQIPLTAMLSPILVPSRTLCAPILRTADAWPLRISRMVPVSSTIPVNMFFPLSVNFLSKPGAEHARCPVPRQGQPVQASFHSLPSIRMSSPSLLTEIFSIRKAWRGSGMPWPSTGVGADAPPKSLGDM